MDGSPFARWNTLRSYTSMMSVMITAWEDFFRAQEIDWITSEDVEAWLTRVRNTISLLETKHMYDDLEFLTINTDESGFPTRRHIDSLLHARSRLSQDEARHRQVKHLFLDSLFANGKINVRSLSHVARARFEGRLAVEDFIEPFRFVSILERQSPTPNRKAYVCVWERFTDKPMLYAMLFEVNADWEQSAEDMSELCENLQGITSHELPLAKIAQRIDISDARLHPKWVSRVVLGPVWIPNHTTDDHVIQRLLDEDHNDAQLCASRVHYEYVFVERETSVSRIRDRKGREHKTTQVFTVRPEPAYRRRGTSFMKETLFVPHELIQELDGQQHVEFGHQLIAIER